MQDHSVFGVLEFVVSRTLYYLDDEKMAVLLESVRKRLKKGAKFLGDTSVGLFFTVS